MYINIDTYKAALQSLSEQKIDNAFWGVLFILKSASKEATLIPKKKLTFFSNQVANELNEIFSFCKTEQQESKNYLILAPDFCEQIQEKFLFNKKIDALSSAILCLRSDLLTNTNKEVIIRQFKSKFRLTDEMFNAWFDSTSDNLIIKTDSSPITQEDINQKIANLPHNCAISFDHSAQTAPFFSGLHIQKKKAGDWGASGYLQKLKPTTKAGEFAAVIHSELLSNFIDKFTETENLLQTKKVGSNKIFYGAPGTGKSHKVRYEECENCEKITTVFHPDTLYTDFVGALKPQMDKDEGGNPIVSYKFRAGPFTKALILSHTKPESNVCLIIEEINRAAAAAVFGEIFQLLDRKITGESTYSIDATDPDMLDYINDKLIAARKLPIETITLPANLSIFATMNSSDQAVMPLDTAFKRRWSFEYLEIDFKHPHVPNIQISIQTKTNKQQISWANIASIINNILTEIGIAEDRLIGQFFLTSNELTDQESIKLALNGKLFVYLWDDVLRHQGRDKIFAKRFKTFGQLSSAFRRDEAVFSNIVEEKLEQLRIEIKSAEAALHDSE